MTTSDAGPIILIGAARSGTKFLRDLLNAGSGTAAVPYDVNYIWRYRNEGHPHDALPPDLLTPQIRDYLMPTLRKQAGAAPGDVLVEKTVSNTLRIPFVAAAIPNARFVHLVRDGRAVTESAMREWQRPPDKGALMRKLRAIPLSNLSYVAWFGMNYLKGLMRGRGGGAVWGPRYPGIDADVAKGDLLQICARQWAESVTAATDDLPAQAQHYTLKYEDLVAGPEAMQALVDWLSLPDPDAVMGAWRSRVSRSGLDKWREALSPADQARLEAQLAPQLARLGYDTPPADQESVNG